MIKYFLTLLLVVVLLATSCTKENESPNEGGFTKENFLEGYLSQTRFNEVADTSINEGNFEFGVEFKPIVNGKLTDILVKLPDVRNDLRVTLWNASDTTILYSDVLDISSAHEMFTFNIDDVQLTGGSTYVICMNSNDWYKRYRKDEEKVTYPIKAGNIYILNYRYKIGSLQEYPDSFPLNYYSGDLSFNFLPTQVRQKKNILNYK